MATWTDHFVAKGLTACGAMLTSADGFCVGDNVSMADICLVPELYNAERRAVGLSKMPEIPAIGNRLMQRADFAAAHPDRFRPDDA